jgi:lantibiotic modifying enzyme
MNLDKKPPKKKAEFTNTEMKLIYAIAEQYCKTNKVALVKEIKSLIRYDRCLFKGRIGSALNRVF